MSKTGFWSDDWLETQRKYWETWTSMNSQALGLAKPAFPSWEGAMDHWWQAVSAGVPQEGRLLVDRMLDQGKAFFHLADNLNQNLQGGDWAAAMEKTINEMQKAFGLSIQNPGDDNLHKMMAFWEMPFDNWQRFASSMSLTPGDMLRNMPHDQVGEKLNRFLSAPGLGYSREEQAQYQDLARRGLAYQKASQDYFKFFSGLGIMSLEQLRERLAKMAADGKSITSYRALYDLWVECCEQVYGEQVATPEHAQVHGALVNALMALKKRMSIMVDENLGALNMPTRTELRTLEDRVQETRRENKRLRRELDALKEQLAGLADKPAATRTAATRKPAAGKNSADGSA